MHCNGTLLELHTLGRVIANAWLIALGRVTGTFPVTIRHMHSELVVIRDSTAEQQPAVGDPPFALLPVIKFTHGLKVASIDTLHGVLIWLLTVITESARVIANKHVTRSMVDEEW